MEISKGFAIQISIFVIGLFLIYYVKKYITPKHQFMWSIISNITFILVFFITAINYLNSKRIEKQNNIKIYVDSILKEFLEIDDYLLKYYDDLKIPFGLMYNKVQLPSSNINLNDKIKDLSPKSKDYLFILFNKITYLLEKVYFTDELLFDNSRLGLKFQLYINNSFYYEYWNTNSSLYTIEFINFINNRYKYLTYKDTTYIKLDSDIYFIPNTIKYNFNFNNKIN
jgi:hypothetical protein